MLAGLPPVRGLAKRAEEHLGGMVVPAPCSGVRLRLHPGPIDGHDIPRLVETLRNMRGLKAPSYCVKIKGKGCRQPAPKDPIGYRRPQVQRTVRPAQSAGGETDLLRHLRSVAVRHRRQDERVVGITPAMREGSRLVKVQPAQYPGSLSSMWSPGCHAGSPSPPASPSPGRSR